MTTPAARWSAATAGTLSVACGEPARSRHRPAGDLAERHAVHHPHPQRRQRRHRRPADRACTLADRGGRWGLAVAPVTPTLKETEALALPSTRRDNRHRPGALRRKVHAHAQPARPDVMRAERRNFRGGSQKLPDGLVDAIVAGHRHDPIAHEVNGVPIIQSYARGRAFGWHRLHRRPRHRTCAGAPPVQPPGDLRTRASARRLCGAGRGERGAGPRSAGRDRRRRSAHRRPAHQRSRPAFI